MSALRKHIALILVVLFGITLLPFNAMHAHDEEKHHTATLTIIEDHCCALENQLCGDEAAGACGHDTHVSVPLPECFACQFQFEKHYQQSSLFLPPLVISGVNITAQPIEHACQAAAQEISNKGPPLLS